MKIFRDRKEISLQDRAEITISGYCDSHVEMQMKRFCETYQDNCSLSSVFISTESLREQTAIFHGERYPKMRSVHRVLISKISNFVSCGRLSLLLFAALLYLPTSVTFQIKIIAVNGYSIGNGIFHVKF